MRKRSFLILLSFYSILGVAACNTSPERKATAAQKPVIGGGCDGCELMYEGMPKDIDAVDTSAGWYEEGNKLVITGCIFKLDGYKHGTGTILYYWQTDNNGLYSPAPGMNEKAKRHGHIRGWVKVGEDGIYKIYTVRPAPYPNDSIPAHIHIAIKEPDKNEYYLDDWVFEDDPLLTRNIRNKMEYRGGAGILVVDTVDGIHTAFPHYVVLGFHIPNYPEQQE